MYGMSTPAAPPGAVTWTASAGACSVALQRVRPQPLNAASPAEKLEQQHDGRDDQQQVDQVAADPPDQAEQPQHQQDDDDRPEHRFLLTPSSVPRTSPFEGDERSVTSHDACQPCMGVLTRLAGDASR